MLKLGMQNISALYVGGAKIKRALVGTEVVYEAVRPPAVFSISASVTPASGGSVTGAGQYREGDTVTLTYTPAEDHRFTGWYAGNTLLSQANPYTFTAAQDMSITARCEVVPTYTLTLTPTGISAQNWSFSILVNGSGATWSGSGASPSSPAPNPVSVKEGSVTVEATSPDGYEFAGWQIGSGSVVTSNPYTFTITGDTTLYCRYAKKSRLPAGYTEVEYVHFPGGTATYFSQAIPSHTQAIAPSIELDVKLGTKNPGTNKILISTSSPNGLTRYFSLTTEGSSSSFTGLRCPTSSANNTMKVLSVSVNQKVHVEIDNLNKVFKVGSSSVSIGGWTFGTSTTTGYAGALGNSLASYVPEMWVYEYKYYTSTQYATKKTLAKHWVPCIRTSDNSIGFYDLVNKTFTAKSGAGTVEAGPAV
jgi:hypothetical protein